MKLFDMRTTYPNTARLVGRLADQHWIEVTAAETLRPAALARIESGATPERDAVRLLIARTHQLRRQKR